MTRSQCVSKRDVKKRGWWSNFRRWENRPPHHTRMSEGIGVGRGTASTFPHSLVIFTFERPKPHPSLIEDYLPLQILFIWHPPSQATEGACAQESHRTNQTIRPVLELQLHSLTSTSLLHCIWETLGHLIQLSGWLFRKGCHSIICIYYSDWISELLYILAPLSQLIFMVFYIECRSFKAAWNICLLYCGCAIGLAIHQLKCTTQY